MWTIRLELWVKDLPHKSQLKGFSPVWTLMCRARLGLLLNSLLHSKHLKVFSSFWSSFMLPCSAVVLHSVFPLQNFKCLPEGKLLPHFLQKYGFSPVCTLMWTIRAEFWVNVLPQKSQLKGFSPVWTLTCRTSWYLCSNSLLHLRHLNAFCPLWLLSTCLIRKESFLNLLPQKRQDFSSLGGCSKST